LSGVLVDVTIIAESSAYKQINNLE